MQLFCVESPNVPEGEDWGPNIIVGNTYTSIDKKTGYELDKKLRQFGAMLFLRGNKKYTDYWFELAETGPGHWYHESHFAEISGDANEELIEEKALAAYIG